MTLAWDTFERYKQKGLDARRVGQWDSARIYLLEAARAMMILSKEAQSDELRQGRRDMAAKLLELARDCDAAKKENRRAAPADSRSAPSAEQRIGFLTLGRAMDRQGKARPSGSTMLPGWTM